jgi:hypothetical protein
MVVITEYIKRHNHKNNNVDTEYINDFKTQALNDIFDRHSNEPEIMKNSDHRHQGNSKNKSFSPAPKFK